MFHHARAQRHLTISRHHDRVTTPHREHRSRPNASAFAEVERMGVRSNAILGQRDVGGVVKGRIHGQLSVYRQSAAASVLASGHPSSSLCPKVAPETGTLRALSSRLTPV